MNKIVKIQGFKRLTDLNVARKTVIRYATRNIRYDISNAVVNSMDTNPMQNVKDVRNKYRQRFEALVFNSMYNKNALVRMLTQAAGIVHLLYDNHLYKSVYNTSTVDYPPNAVLKTAFVQFILFDYAVMYKGTPSLPYEVFQEINYIIQNTPLLEAKPELVAFTYIKKFRT